MLHDSVRKRSFASASIWAQVPHYVAAPPNPKATRAILDKLAGLLDLHLDLTDLDIAVEPRGSAPSPTSSPPTRT